MRFFLLISAFLFILSCNRTTQRLDDFEVHGIDISRYQSTINWEKVWEQDIHRKLTQAAGTLLLRSWMEKIYILIQYLRVSSSSPYFPMDSIFVRDEFQYLNGKLPHIHLKCYFKY